MGTSLRPTSPPWAMDLPSTRTSAALNGSPRVGREQGLERPVLARCEGLDLALALDDEADGDRLDPARGQARSGPCGEISGLSV